MTFGRRRAPPGDHARSVPFVPACVNIDTTNATCPELELLATRQAETIWGQCSSCIEASQAQPTSDERTDGCVQRERELIEREGKNRNAHGHDDERIAPALGAPRDDHDTHDHRHPQSDER